MIMFMTTFLPYCLCTRQAIVTIDPFSYSCGHDNGYIYCYGNGYDYDNSYIHCYGYGYDSDLTLLFVYPVCYCNYLSIFLTRMDLMGH